MRNITSLVIPEGGVSIGASAFRLCAGLTSVTLPESLTSIEPWAFAHCQNLTEIGSTVTIRSSADGSEAALDALADAIAAEA